LGSAQAEAVEHPAVAVLEQHVNVMEEAIRTTKSVPARIAV
jgi:hypothetical protein